jgi:hypothetical protein
LMLRQPRRGVARQTGAAHALTVCGHGEGWVALRVRAFRKGGVSRIQARNRGMTPLLRGCRQRRIECRDVLIDRR